jgi:hypothetical protein
MELDVEGWDRVVLHRDLGPGPLHDSIADNEHTYPYTGSHMSVDERGVSVRYRLQLEQTMGGEYKAEIRISVTELFLMLIKLSAYLTFDQFVHYLNGGTRKGLGMKSMWRGPMRDQADEF